MPIAPDATTAALHATARELVADRRGILAADESIATMSARLEKAGVTPTGTGRRDYRELLVTTPDLHEGVSGVILCDETLRQRLADGRPFPRALRDLGLLPGIKVDTGTTHLPGTAGELVTEGLDGLPARLAEYAELGARFAKWRAVIRIGEATPSPWALAANAHALARYASACQAAGIVPVVEPEVLMDGAHPLSRCASATTDALTALFDALRDARVDLRGTVLKPNMVVPGDGSPQRCPPAAVARATVDVLGAVLPDGLAGVAFLSGGQAPETATAHLAAMQEIDTPWPLTFSFGRALVSPALLEWRGAPDRVAAAQATLARLVRRNAAVLRGSGAPLQTA
ncbi:class I fructose-bisphosphate aldolase [Pseudonocardia sp.]|uniref:class I fructose-bisphosphate aldolase n=1 Tax=Pseudonocardia sp. TaxID=60912 RepID=UPI0026062F7A|nr:class I fructose-bisphosphate aldolase [Pseudonocardia sp.]